MNVNHNALLSGPHCNFTFSKTSQFQELIYQSFLLKCPTMPITSPASAVNYCYFEKGFRFLSCPSMAAKKAEVYVHYWRSLVLEAASFDSSSTQASPDKFGGVSYYSPCLFGKGIVVKARQTYIQQTKTFTKTKLI